MEREDISKILEKFANQTVSKAEKAKFIEWLREVSDFEYQETLHFYSKIVKSQTVNRKPNPILLQNIKRDIKKEANKKLVAPYKLWPNKFAALIGSAVVLFLIAAAFFTNQRIEKKTELIAASPRAEKNGLVFLPVDKATLILEDGSRIFLDDIEDGKYIKQSGTTIYKSKNSITYTVEKPGNEVKANLHYNTISIPRGCQYRVNLPDGSKVWMNAGTSLSFPTAFAAFDRKMQLIGEAYFEVAKIDNKPFSVVSNNQIVKVLGTHFNVNSYTDEELMKTSLLEGSVEVVSINKTSKKEVNKVILKPGQQSQVTPIKGNLHIAKVGNEVAAWKEGHFDFNQEDIKGIMRKVARWYDLEIEYKGKISNERFVGSISYLENVSDVLEALEIAGDVHFKVKGRRITVMP